MNIRTIKTMTMNDQARTPIHLYHLLYMQSLHRHHQQNLHQDFWTQQGKYPYHVLWQAMMTDPDCQSALRQSDLIVIVYQSHEYNPRQHLAGVIEQSTQTKAMMVDIIDCGPMALGIALLMARSHESTHPNISLLLFEQKTRDASHANRYDTTQNNISLLSTIDSSSLRNSLTINKIMHNDYPQSLHAFNRKNAHDNTICITNRPELCDQLNNDQKHYFFMHGYAYLMQQIHAICQMNAETSLWVHLMGHGSQDSCCLWLDIQPKRIAS